MNSVPSIYNKYVVIAITVFRAKYIADPIWHLWRFIFVRAQQNYSKFIAFCPVFYQQISGSIWNTTYSGAYTLIHYGPKPISALLHSDSSALTVNVGRHSSTRLSHATRKSKAHFRFRLASTLTSETHPRWINSKHCGLDVSLYSTPWSVQSRRAN